MPKPAELKTTPMPVACFAPPLTDDLIAKYEPLADALPRERYDVRDAMRECFAAAKLWWELPESKGQPRDKKLEIRHRGKDVLINEVSLTPDLVEKLWDAVPWGYEIKSMKALFDRAFWGIEVLPTGEVVRHEPWLTDVPTRDAAFHLLWHAAELCLDREPLTLDRLPG